MHGQDRKLNPNLLATAAAERIYAASGIEQHHVAIILGSGWRDATQVMGETRSAITAADVPGFSASKVEGHTGIIYSIVLGNGKNALVIGARTHLYEGTGVKAVVHPVRTAAACGAKSIILTNGAGGIKDGFCPGQPVLISDHINLTGASPLIGPNFVDLTDLYSRRLRDISKTVNRGLQEGVYVQFQGPQYETPAEVRMARAMGGDIVGMSTALEAIAARESGMEVLGLSLITNMAAGISATPLSHQEVMEAGETAGPAISRLLSDITQLV